MARTAGSAAGADDARRIWGWYFFDWASQPYSTLLTTFIFGPYIQDILGDGARGQSVWGLTIGAAGVAIALLAPVLGAVADRSGRRIAWIRAISVVYVLGAASTWFAAPDGALWPVLILFALGLAALEFATIFTNALLPDLAPRSEIGRVSGTGWAFGYLGGLVALVFVLFGLAEDAATGRTLIGLSPAFGLDPETREGTRAVGPFTALWYAVFMVPFFWWMRDPAPVVAEPGGLGPALRGLMRTIRRLPATPSRFAYLGASMLYRDGLTGAYALGAVFAAGVLGWSVTQTGIFGILAVISGAVFAWIGGRADARYGPKPVIVAGVWAVLLAVLLATLTTREAILFVPVPEGSRMPDIVFMAVGCLIGGAGGAVQSSSRTMMVRQGDPDHMTEAFGLYALSGKATAFVAPLAVGAATAVTGSQQAGVLPLVVLFGTGLWLLRFVDPEGDRT